MGEIEAVGDGVELTAGSRVAALTVHGSYALHRTLPADQCVPVPDGADPAQAVALVLNYLTARQMLHRVARLEAGDSVLIHAAAGGVGTAVLELARATGIRVIGLCSAARHERVRALGGVPIDYRSEDVADRVRVLTNGRGVDAVLEAVGGPETRRSWDVVRPTGMVVCYGALSVASNGRVGPRSALSSLLRAPRFTPMRLLTDVKGVIGYNVDSWRRQRPDAYRADLAALIAMLAEGTLDPPIGAGCCWRRRRMRSGCWAAATPRASWCWCRPPTERAPAVDPGTPRSTSGTGRAYPHRHRFRHWRTMRRDLPRCRSRE